MNSNPNLQTATQLYSEGRQTEATAIFQDLMKNTKDHIVFLNAVLGYVVSESRLNAGPDLIARTTQGIKIAEQLGDNDVLAYLLSTKAQFLSDEMGMLEYRQNNIVLTPRRFNFSLERDSKLSTELITKIDQYRKEIVDLFTKALELSQSTKDKKTEGHIYLQIAEYHSSEYLRIRGRSVTKNDRFRFLYKYRILLHRGYDRYFMYTSEIRKELKKSIKLSIENYEKSIICHKELGDKNAEAYCYYNYAVHLKSFSLFRKANKILLKAEALAVEAKNKSLHARIVLLKENLKAKNSDTPDYLEGETRNTEDSVLDLIKKGKV